MEKHNTRQTEASKPAGFTRRLIAIGIVVLLAMTALTLNERQADALNAFDTELFSLINQHRTGLGLDAFVEYEPFSDAALAWSTANRAAANVTCPAGAPSSAGRHDSNSNIASQGVPPGTARTGENLAWACGAPGVTQDAGFTYANMPAVCLGEVEFHTPQFALCQWINSPAHRPAIESTFFTTIGLGTVTKAAGSGLTEYFTTARFAEAPVVTSTPTPVPTPTGPNCNGLEITVYIAQGDRPTNGDDVIMGTNGADRIYALGGDDVVCGGGGIDRIVGGDGDDEIFGEGGSDRIFGNAGFDRLVGGSGADRMWGGDDDDEMLGQGGQDFMYGGDGDDEMQGNWQTDRMWGGDGDDVMRGAGGKDRLYGEAGDDDLYGGFNTDYLNGGPGNDFGHGQQGKDNPLVPGVSGCEELEQRVSC